MVVVVDRVQPDPGRSSRRVWAQAESPRCSQGPNRGPPAEDQTAQSAPGPGEDPASGERGGRGGPSRSPPPACAARDRTAGNKRRGRRPGRGGGEGQGGGEGGWELGAIPCLTSSHPHLAWGLHRCPCDGQHSITRHAAASPGGRNAQRLARGTCGRTTKACDMRGARATAVQVASYRQREMQAYTLSL